MANKINGKLGEFMARCYMRLYGYGIVCRNYVTGRGTTAGEIDFVARKGKLLVFAEVKERNKIEHAVVAISRQQQKRIVVAAEVFLQHNPAYKDFDIRFDALFVKLPFTIVHIKNAWGAEVLQNKNPRR